jgi:hypothetical protein
MSANTFYPHTEREQLAPFANKRVLVTGKVQHIAAWMSGKRWGLRATLKQCRVKHGNIQVSVDHFTVNVGKQFIAVRAKRNTIVSFYATVKVYQPDKQLKYVPDDVKVALGLTPRVPSYGIKWPTRVEVVSRC